MRLTIGLDLDGCLACVDNEMAFRMQENGWPTNVDKWHSYFLEENHPEIPVDWILKQFEDPTFWLNAIPYEDAWFMTNKWFMDNCDIFIITAREREAEEATLRWLTEWQINYNDIFCGAKQLHKNRYIEALGLDIFIEDNPMEANILAKEIPTYLLDRPYNMRYDTEGVHRVSSFYEIDKEIVKWKQESSALDAERNIQ